MIHWGVAGEHAQWKRERATHTKSVAFFSFFVLGVNLISCRSLCVVLRLLKTHVWKRVTHTERKREKAPIITTCSLHLHHERRSSSSKLEHTHTLDAWTSLRTNCNRRQRIKKNSTWSAGRWVINLPSTCVCVCAYWIIQQKSPLKRSIDFLLLQLLFSLFFFFFFGHNTKTGAKRKK